MRATLYRHALRSGTVLFSAAHCLAAVLLAVTAPASDAASLDFSVEPGLFSDALKIPANNLIESGMGLAMRNQLLKVAVDYDFQVNMDNQLSATDDNTAQRVAATVQSTPLNRLLGMNTRFNADSIYRSATGAYDHRITPGFSRPLLGLATLDVNYQFLLNRPFAEAAEQQHQAYSLGLRGSARGGRLHWNGTYRAAEIYRDSSSPIQSSETFSFHSNYRVLPGMHLQLSSALTRRTFFRATSANSFDQTQYGAGLVWHPSAHYSLNVTVNHLSQQQSGEDALLRSGTLSWFPRENLALSLNYGDQLVDGLPAVLLNTRLQFDAL